MNSKLKDRVDDRELINVLFNYQTFYIVIILKFKVDLIKIWSSLLTLKKQNKNKNKFKKYSKSKSSENARKSNITKT